MPVTAKLSRKFYDKLGEDVASELVEWFNQVDATYRSELRDLFAVHFDRFDAKLEQRVAELRSESREAIGILKADLRTEIAEAKSDLIRRMFIYWAGSSVTTVGLVITIVKLL